MGQQAVAAAARAAAAGGGGAQQPCSSHRSTHLIALPAAAPAAGVLGAPGAAAAAPTRSSSLAARCRRFRRAAKLLHGTRCRPLQLLQQGQPPAPQPAQLRRHAASPARCRPLKAVVVFRWFGNLPRLSDPLRVGAAWRHAAAPACCRRARVRLPVLPRSFPASPVPLACSHHATSTPCCLVQRQLTSMCVAGPAKGWVTEHRLGRGKAAKKRCCRERREEFGAGGGIQASQRIHFGVETHLLWRGK